MLSFYHAPMSRSGTVAQAIEEMGVADQIDTHVTNIPRQDGSGGPDAANPHPEKKVPALVHDGLVITERAAILAYLSELFPNAPTAVPPGHAQRGPFLGWLAYYCGVTEPMLMARVAEVDHPVFANVFQGVDEMVARMRPALQSHDYLLPTGFSAADLLMASPYMWNRDWLPDVPEIRAWFERIEARPGVKAAASRYAA